MFLHIGNNKSLYVDNIIGIFDMDTSTVSKITKEYLKKLDQSEMTFDVSGEIPKSFVLTKDKKIYFSQLSSATLCDRIKNFG